MTHRRFSITANDIWAVGRADYSSDIEYRALAVHQDGATWAPRFMTGTEAAERRARHAPAIPTHVGRFGYVLLGFTLP
jgi:hypothetical protein